MSSSAVAIWLSTALLAALGSASAQQSIPPPPRPPDSGPSLEVTLKFVQDKVGDEGKLSYSAAVTDTAQQGVEWTNKFEVELSNPTFNTGACSVSFHWHSVVNDKVADDSNYTINLREVSQVVLLSQEENQAKVDTRNGHDTWQSRIAPPLFVLVVQRPKKVENALLFSEKDMADRVAKALVHAVELCGGGSKEPF